MNEIDIDMVSLFFCFWYRKNNVGRAEDTQGTRGKGFSISLLLDIFWFSLHLVKGLISLYKLMLLIGFGNGDLTWIKPKLP